MSLADKRAFPASVEESGAILGATITTYGKESSEIHQPPKGMHSSFATKTRIPASEMVSNLYDLRALLRAEDTPLESAPSLLAVLMKLLGVSTALANSKTTSPMLSTPIRRLWVDCVAICHERAPKNETRPFVRQMLSLAAQHPRSARAGGGVRIAALDIVAALAPTVDVYEILSVALKALRSAGNGEPTYRISAVAMARKVVHRQTIHKTATELCGRWQEEERTLLEAIKIVRQAATDKVAQVRTGAANLLCLLTPFVVGPNWNLWDECLVLASKNIDDESPFVAMQWSEAVARCLSVAVLWHGKESKASSVEGGARKGVGPTLSTVKQVVQYLVDHYTKAGGELNASRCGGSFSVGGRAVRMGWTCSLMTFYRIQHSTSVIGSEGFGITDAIKSALLLAGSNVDKAIAEGPTLFGGMKTVSPFDPILNRLAAARVIRRGFSELCSETVQLKIVQSLLQMIQPGNRLHTLQLQVIFGELAHLLVTLGESGSEVAVELHEPVLEALGHADFGVRFEAVVLGEAIAMTFPSEGIKLLSKCLEGVQEHHARVVTLASVTNSPREEQEAFAKRVFGRSRSREVEEDPTVSHQCAIHGMSLMAALMIKVLPQSSRRGLSLTHLTGALSVAEVLLSCQHNSKLVSTQPAAVTCCVRSGFALYSGILACGPDSVYDHIPMIIDSCAKSCSSVSSGKSVMSRNQDLGCIEAMLTCIVGFLKHNSELLLSVPDALSKIVLILEDSLKLFAGNGHFKGLAALAGLRFRVDSAKATLLEAFSWLPSGSFPVAAEDVFDMACQHIKQAVEDNIACSMLTSVVNKEDGILDLKSTERARRFEHFGSHSDVGETIAVLSSALAIHQEREATLLLQAQRNDSLDPSPRFRKSRVLGRHLLGNPEPAPPTPLHEVGTWSRPIESSLVTKIRLVDSAIQVFSATFGLKSGQEQQEAMDMLEALIPPLLTQLAMSLGVNTPLADFDRRPKGQEDKAAITNVTAALLSCLQSLPLHESTHNVPIGLGPTWMNKAKKLLLTVIPTDSSIIRRAAAEGLSLLATVGVSEDAHFLQSSVLHSLDELMQGNKGDGKPRPLMVDPVSSVRAGSVVALSFIQRTSYFARNKSAQSKQRSFSEDHDRDKIDRNLPVLQMMTRILPSVSCSGVQDYFVTRTFAIHAFNVLVSYSERLKSQRLDAESLQLLRKAVELIEENMSVAWSSSSADIDKGQENDKLETETAFLAVIIRLMTICVPFLHHLTDENSGVATRFSRLATLALETSQSPAIVNETMALNEVLLAFQDSLLPPLKAQVVNSESSIMSCLPVILNSLRLSWTGDTASVSLSAKSSVSVQSVACLLEFMTATLKNMPNARKLFVQTILALETLSGACEHKSSTYAASVALNAEDDIAIEQERTARDDLVSSLETMVKSMHSTDDLVQVTLVCKAVALSSARPPEEITSSDSIKSTSTKKREMSVAEDSSIVLGLRSPIRLVVKQACTRLARLSCHFCHSLCVSEGRVKREFDPIPALQDFQSSGPETPSHMAFHIEDLVVWSCMSSVASLDRVDLFSVQLESSQLLSLIIGIFGNCSDPEDQSISVLDQYLTQILPSVKHAITAHQESDSRDARLLCRAGCEALVSVVDAKLTSDHAVLNRILRPIVLDDCSFVAIDSSSHSYLEEASAFPTLCKLWACGKVVLDGNELVALPPQVKTSLVRTSQTIMNLASMCAAVAVDGAQVAFPRPRDMGSAIAGIGFRNSNDLDGDVKDFLVDSWADFASFAIKSLSVDSDSCLDEQKAACREWLEALVPLLFAGLSKFDLSSQRMQRLAASCFYGIAQVLRYNPATIVETVSAECMKQVLQLIGDYVVQPLIDDMDNVPNFKTTSCASKLVLAASQVEQDSLQINDAVLQVHLRVLSALEQKNLSIGSREVDCLLSSSFRGVSKLVDRGLVASEAVQAVLKLVQQVLHSDVDGAVDLMLSCIASPHTSAESVTKAVQLLVEADMWSAWKSLATIDDGNMLITSLPSVCNKVAVGDFETKQKVMTFLVGTLQDADWPRSVTPHVLKHVGGEAMVVLYQVGTQLVSASPIERQKVCADVVKLMLLCHQELLSDADELPMFLSLFFDVLLVLLRFNGLPNYPAPSGKGDQAIGRMCAQTVLHIARTSSEPFKSHMASVLEQDRTLLEFAVRAEMTGYAMGTGQPAEKKKLSLKGFT